MQQRAREFVGLGIALQRFEASTPAELTVLGGIPVGAALLAAGYANAGMVAGMALAPREQRPLAAVLGAGAAVGMAYVTFNLRVRAYLFCRIGLMCFHDNRSDSPDAESVPVGPCSLRGLKEGGSPMEHSHLSALQLKHAGLERHHAPQQRLVAAHAIQCHRAVHALQHSRCRRPRTSDLLAQHALQQVKMQ